MSDFMKSLQFGYLKNKERDNFFISDDDNDDFNFKYIPENQMKNVIKHVRRQKTKVDEENAWASFVEQQDVEQLYHHLNEIDSNFQNVNCFTSKCLVAEQDHFRWEDDLFPEEIADQKSPLVKDNGSGSTNFLLTIPEEDLLIRDRSREVMKDRNRTNTRKASSAPGVRRKKENSKRLISAMNHDNDYSSTPEFSPDRLSDKDEIIYVRPDPTIVAKIVATQKKISEILDEIAFRLGRIPLPDGDRDLYRRQQRVMEFSIRFARNYLYDLGRQVAEIRRHINAIAPGARRKIGRRAVTFHVQVIEQKLATAHQLLLHALSAYCKHIPSSVLKGHPGKLKDILQVVLDLKEFCEKIHLVPDCIGSGDMEGLPLGKETDNKCSAILSKLRLSSDESQLVSHTTRSTAATTMRSKRRNLRKQTTNRFSMYNMDPRLPKNQPNRRPKSFSQKEKRRSVNVVKNNRLPTPEFIHPSPIDSKSKEPTTKNGFSKIINPPKEDDIQTIMEIIPTDSDACSSVDNSDENSQVKKVTSNFQNFHKIHQATNEEELHRKISELTEDHLSNLVPVIADLMSIIKNNPKDKGNKSSSSVPIETLVKIIEKYQKVSGSKEKSKKTAEGTAKISKPKNGICSGSKNMQLLCVESNEDYQDYQEPSKFINVSCQANDCLTETAVRKNGLINLEVSDDLEFRLLEYKQMYQSITESSQMYCNHTQNKPWDIVAWVSDQLVSELIVDLSKELQMDDVIKKLFELEFQEL
ncbi:uncharacterized protein LOC122510443 [Leptopilina heterotoma]|uniref:uncharacterized protein LOC122510443 n=1 Tax=Leptopilina heterotoma TaxID=63436 RepID=UPI001CA8DA61|nr:uncharacterized protein LOC122510443 [Leptopilina heterotoma]